MEPEIILRKLLDAITKEKSIKKFFSYVYLFGKTTIKEHLALRNSFLRIGLFFLLIIFSFDLFFILIIPSFFTYLFIFISKMWYAGIVYITFSMLGLVRDEEGNYLKKINISNVLSLLRMFLIPYVFFTILYYDSFSNYKYFIITIYGITALSDALDGFIARTTHTVTMFGRLIDPICDVMFNSIISIALFATNAVPFFVMVLILTRYLMPLFGGFFIYVRKEPYKIEATWAGKLSGICVGIYMGIQVLVLYIPKLIPELALKSLMYIAITSLIINIIYLFVRGFQFLKA